MRIASLCTGYGGLDLGVHLARPDARTVLCIERQAYAAAVLVARMQDGQFDECPIWDDLGTFDGRPWRGAVDLVTAGYPCQPESVAGKRLGEVDERWLWPEVWRVVREMGPRLVFLENVPGHLSGTFGRVLGSMAESGWRIEWDCVPAAAVGAPHLRDRLFVLAANPECVDLRNESVTQSRSSHQTQSHDAGVARSVADADVDGLQGERSGGVLDGERAPRRRDTDRRRRSKATDAEGMRGQNTGQHGAAPVAGGHGEGRASTDAECPRLEEWRGLSGDPGAEREAVERGDHFWGRVAAPESSFRRVDDGVASPLDRDWADQIHLLGNGVVPQAAARAWRTLAARLGEEG
jgi:DNA (cytosine-5)-methyltransferase 1